MVSLVWLPLELNSCRACLAIHNAVRPSPRKISHIHVIPKPPNFFLNLKHSFLYLLLVLSLQCQACGSSAVTRTDVCTFKSLWTIISLHTLSCRTVGSTAKKSPLRRCEMALLHIKQGI